MASLPNFLHPLFYYLLGGLTFIPLCGLLLVAHFILNAPPYVAHSAQPIGDDDHPLTPARKIEALDLAKLNAAATAHVAKESAKPAREGDAFAPPAAKRVGPAPPAAPKPHRSGWLVVRRQFEGDSPAAILAAARAASAKNKSGGDEAGQAGADGKAAPAEGKPGYMSAMYRGVLSLRQKRGEAAAAAASSTASAAAPKEGEDVTTLDKPAAAPPAAPKRSSTQNSVAANTRESFHAILKGPILYLYSSPDASAPDTECHAAIDLRGKRVSIFVAHMGDVAGEPDAGEQGWSKARQAAVRDGELFTKRNAVRIVAGAGAGAGRKGASTTVKYAQWFIFARSASTLEDWYHALLHASQMPADQPGQKPKHSDADTLGAVFDAQDMVRLLASLDTLPDPIPLRWLNALLGRVFFSIYRTAWLEDYVTRKIMKKMSRVRTPGYLSDITVRDVDLGRAPPAFSRPMLKSLTGDGEASMEVAIHYTGAIRLTISTVLTISLGSRFKPYNVPLLLAVVINSLSGNLLLHIKPPPSNRLWFGFTQLPEMDISVEPVVSARKVQWSMVKRLIEGRIRELLTESLVVPNMDDIPFFDTRPLQHRGGIWADASKRDGSAAGDEAEEAAASTPEEQVETRRGSAPAAVIESQIAEGSSASTARDIPGSDAKALRNRRAATALSSPAPSPVTGTTSLAAPSLSTSPSSGAIEGLSTLLARDQAAATASTASLPADLASTRTASTQSVPVAPSKRRSWFVPTRFGPGQDPSKQPSSSSKAGRSSLAWGSASLADGNAGQPVLSQEPLTSSADELAASHDEADELSEMEGELALTDGEQADEVQFATDRTRSASYKGHRVASSASSIRTADSHGSVDTSELHSSLIAAVGGAEGEVEGGLTAAELAAGLPTPRPSRDGRRDEAGSQQSFASSSSAGTSPSTRSDALTPLAPSFTPVVTVSPAADSPTSTTSPTSAGSLTRESTLLSSSSRRARERTSQQSRDASPDSTKSQPMQDLPVPPAPVRRTTAMSSNSTASTNSSLSSTPSTLAQVSRGPSVDPVMARDARAAHEALAAASREAPPTSQALLAWNKAKASMADKESRNAAAKEAKDALKRGWASWNSSRRGEASAASTAPPSPGPGASERAASWLTKDAPDLGAGFGAGGNTSPGRAPSTRSSSSSSSGRPAYKDYRGRREQRPVEGAAEEMGTASVPEVLTRITPAAQAPAPPPKPKPEVKPTAAQSDAPQKPASTATQSTLIEPKRDVLSQAPRTSPRASPSRPVVDLAPASAAPPTPAVGIKKQPQRASMMMVPGIPSSHRAEPQSFSAPPPEPSVTTAGNSPRLGLAMFKGMSFAGSPKMEGEAKLPAAALPAPAASGSAESGKVENSELAPASSVAASSAPSSANQATSSATADTGSSSAQPTHDEAPSIPVLTPTPFAALAQAPTSASAIVTPTPDVGASDQAPTFTQNDTQLDASSTLSASAPEDASPLNTTIEASHLLDNTDATTSDTSATANASPAQDGTSSSFPIMPLLSSTPSDTHAPDGDINTSAMTPSPSTDTIRE